MKLIVGLGNYGDKYKNTRHNTGFLVVDEIARKLNISITQKDFESLIAKFNYQGQQVILMKPLTYMNESGRAVIQAVNYYHLDPEEDVLVIYDDLDLKCGQLRIRMKGSAGGHNGIKSLIAHLKTQRFKRIRVGIDKDINIPVIDYVLGKVKEEDRKIYQSSLERASLAAIDFINQPFERVMNKYNQKENE